MSTSAAAALYVQGNVLRYVEVERTDAAPSVATVGRYTFDVDIASRLLGPEAAPGDRQDVDLPLADIGDLLRRKQGRVVVHPTQVYSFFVPLPADATPAERRQQVLQQVALVAGPEAATDHDVLASAVRPAPDQRGTPYEWLHLLALPEAAASRVQSILGAEVPDGWAWMVSSEGAAHGRLAPPSEAEPSGLLIGAYAGHAEFSLVQAGEWHHAQFTDAAASPEDVLYFARAFLNRLGLTPKDVRAVWAYGDSIDPTLRTAVEADTGLDFHVIDPFAELEGEVALDGDRRPAFAPCVGAALKELASG